MELPTKRVKEGVSCHALLSLESLLKKLQSNPFKARLVRLPVIDRRVFRFGFDESDKRCTSLKSVMRDQIVALIENEGVTHFITGMALGVDMYAAEIVLDLKSKYPHITLESAIPCETQAIKWSVASRERYYNIAAKCDKETMLQREYTPDCMDKRNRYMVDHADYILAVWNGCPSGTGNTVRYAHKKGKSIIVINPVSLDVTRE